MLTGTHGIISLIFHVIVDFINSFILFYVVSIEYRVVNRIQLPRVFLDARTSLHEGMSVSNTPKIVKLGSWAWSLS